MNTLDISSITFSYDEAPVYALQNFSLTVADGNMHALQKLLVPSRNLTPSLWIRLSG